jgi:mannose-6-phosphate isomerase-like protein (cupin superfamily)
MDGPSQMASWNCGEAAVSAEHAHGYDEYMVVVEGCYTLIVGAGGSRSRSAMTPLPAVAALS